MRLELTVTYEDRPDDPQTVMAWQTDFVALERTYPEVDLANGEMGKIEHMQYLGWSVFSRHGWTEEPFEAWRQLVEVMPVENEIPAWDDPEVLAVRLDYVQELLGQYVTDSGDNAETARLIHAEAEAITARLKELTEPEGTDDADDAPGEAPAV